MPQQYDYAGALSQGFNLGLGLLSNIRVMHAEMQDRAYKIKFDEEIAPALEAKTQEQNQVIAAAAAEAQKAVESGDDVAAAKAQRVLMQAYTNAANQLAPIYAQVASSDNPYAAKAGAAYNEAMMGNLGRMSQAAAQQQQAMAQDHQWKLENLQAEGQGKRQQQQLDQGEEQLRQSKEQFPLEMDAKRADVDARNAATAASRDEIALRRDELPARQAESKARLAAAEADKARAERGPLIDPAERAKARFALDAAVKEGDMTAKQAEFHYKDLGIPIDQRDPELADKELEKERSDLQKARENTTDPKRIQRIDARLAKIQIESDASIDLRLDEKEHPGSWRKTLGEIIGAGGSPDNALLGSVISGDSDEPEMPRAPAAPTASGR